MTASAQLIIPISAVLPLGAASALAGANRLLPRRVRDMLAVGAALATTALCLVAMVESYGHPVVYWFSGWHPVSGVVIGVDYAVDPLGSALAALSGVLVSAALMYSWRYFESVGGRYNALVLIFLAASVDFCLTGDLFNLFVAFELVAITGFVLTGYNADRRASLQGAINFAVTNSVAGMAVLLGIGLVYARTGALNLAAIGHALAGHHADGLVVVSFALLMGGFMVKAAVVPFHFWLPDAYGTAPIPVCVLFSGVMSELGLFAVARVWDTIYSGLGGGVEHRLQLVLVGLGIITALVGPVMALAQVNVKRMLAFVTVSHVGLYLIGFGLLSSLGLAGASLMVMGDGLAKGALFLCVGVLQQHHSSIDELKLRAKGAGMWLVGAMVLVGALALADLPPFVSSDGKNLLISAAQRSGLGWLEIVVALCVIVSSGAVLRAAGRIWLGWGPVAQGAQVEEAGQRLPAGGGAEQDPQAEQGQSGTDDDPGDQEIAQRPRRRSPLVMVVPPLMLLAVSLGLGLAPGLAQAASNAAAGFADRPAYAAAVLRGVDRPLPRHSVPATPTTDILIDLGEAAGASALGVVALLRGPWGRRLRSIAADSSRWLRRLHTGLVGDQVTWVVAGLALLAGLSALALR
ncbi:MAG: complex I subunit 5 family protein [Acidimicrobiales bacterium]